MDNNFAKTSLLYRLNLKKDWLKMTLWIVILGSVFLGVAAAFNRLYGTSSAIDAIVTTLKTPAMAALFGKMPVMATYTTASVYGSEMTLFMSFLAVMMNIMIGVKNTRGEEESGLVELVNAHSVGRLAHLGAVIDQLLTLNIFYGVAVGGLLSLVPMAHNTFSGALLIGLIQSGVGLVFGMVAVLAAQLLSTSRAATMFSYLIFAVCYMLAMIGNTVNKQVLWFTPFGWVTNAAPYVNNNYAMLVLLFGLAGILAVGAILLSKTRDLMDGVIPEKDTHERSSHYLQGPLTLRLNLEHSVIFGWSVGLFIFAAMYASVFGTIGDIVKSNPMLQKVLGTAQINASSQKVVLHYVGFLLIIFSVLIVIAGNNVLHKLVTDQQKGYLELIEAKPVTRNRLFMSYVIVASVVSVLSLLMAILGLYLVGNANLGYQINFAVYWESFLAYLPVIAVFMAVALFLIIYWPKLYMINWLYLGFGFYTVYLGSLMKLSTTVKRLTPFGWVDRLPVDHLNSFVVMVLYGIAGLLVLLSWWHYQQKDLV